MTLLRDLRSSDRPLSSSPSFSQHHSSLTSDARYAVRKSDATLKGYKTPTLAGSKPHTPVIYLKNMSPTAIVDNAPIAADPANLKAKLVAGQVEVEKASPPVADNFMYDFKYNHALPTIDVLGQDIAADVNAQEVAEELLAKLEQALGAGDAAAFPGLFIDYGKSLTPRPLTSAVH